MQDIVEGRKKIMKQPTTADLESIDRFLNDMLPIYPKDSLKRFTESIERGDYPALKFMIDADGATPIPPKRIRWRKPKKLLLLPFYPSKS